MAVEYNEIKEIKLFKLLKIISLLELVVNYVVFVEIPYCWYYYVREFKILNLIPVS